MAYRKNISVTIGAVSLLVDVNSAVDTGDDRSLKTVCLGAPGAPKHPPTAVNRKMVCSSCDNSDDSTFERADVDGGQFTVVSVEEVAEARAAATAATKHIIALTPHPIDDMRPLMVQGPNSTYALTPSKPAFATAYGLLVDMMRRHPELGWLGQWTPSSRVGLYEFRLFGDTIVMEPRARADAIAVPAVALPPIPSEHQAQIDLLLGTMVQPFDPASYGDTYLDAMSALLASKQAETGVLPSTADRTPRANVAPVLDLSSLLTASLAAQGVEAPKPKTTRRRKTAAA